MAEPASYDDEVTAVTPYKLCRQCHGWGTVTIRHTDGLRTTEDCLHCAGSGEES